MSVDMYRSGCHPKTAADGNELLVFFELAPALWSQTSFVILRFLFDSCSS